MSNIKNTLEDLLETDKHAPLRIEQPNKPVGTIASGVKYDQGKPMLALIPAEAIEEEGKVWTFGATKYGNHNWLGGLSYLRILSALLRHSFAIVRGEDYDAESGLLHAAHVRACAGMLITFHKQNRTDLDDRYKEPKK